MDIVIEGNPVAQIRMKYSGRNGFGRIYDPRFKEKQAIKALINKLFAGFEKVVHPKVSFVFHTAIPKATKKKDLPIYLSGKLKDERKPDVDNYVKLYLDCMDDIVFDGDQKVMLGDCIKLYHPHPKTIILVEDMSEVITQAEVGPLMWEYLFGQECG